MSIRRRWVALLLGGGAALLAAVLVSAAAAGPSPGNGPVQTRVFGGGNVPIYTCTDGATVFCTQVTREFSISAVSDPSGDHVYGTIISGNVERDHGINSVVRVTCLAVSGNVAEIGGVIVQAADPSLVGGPFEMFVRDSGQPGAVSRDGVSPVFSSPPPGKADCHDASSDAFGYGFFQLTYGDIAVQKG